MTVSPFADSIREQLMDAAHRERRRRRFTKIGAAIAAVLAAISAAVLGPGSSPVVAQGVKVTVEEGVVEVLITDLNTTPEKVIAALREAGYDASVRGVPTGPSLVGRFVSALIDGPNPEQVAMFGHDGSGFDGFRIKEGWTGRLEIGLGRAAEPGEGYDAFTNLEAEGEPLECAGIIGAPLEAGAAAMRASGLRYELQPTDNVGVPQGGRLTLDEAVRLHGSWIVTSASAGSATFALVFLAEDPNPGVTAPVPEC